MSTEENKAIYLRTLHEIWSQGKEEVADELFADDFVHHDVEVQMADKGRERLRMFRAAAPDVTFEAEIVIAEGDLVACYYKGHGTHTGELWGITPTGKAFTFKGVDIVRIVDRNIVEAWDVPDLFGLLGQLGLLSLGNAAQA